jgi:hypothetical protein
MLRSELLSDSANRFLKVCSEEFTINKERIGLNEIFELLILRVEVTDGVISAVLASELAREAEPIR